MWAVDFIGMVDDTRLTCLVGGGFDERPSSATVAGFYETAPVEQKKHTQRLELEQNNQNNRPRNTLNQKTPGFSAACKARIDHPRTPRVL
jgi:hypothetical protein